MVSKKPLFAYDFGRHKCLTKIFKYDNIKTVNQTLRREAMLEDARTKKGFLKTWLLGFLIIASAPVWEFLNSDLSFIEFTYPLGFLLYATLGGFVVAILWNLSERVLSFMDSTNEGRKTVRMIVLAVLVAVTFALAVLAFAKTS